MWQHDKQHIHVLDDILQHQHQLQCNEVYILFLYHQTKFNSIESVLNKRCVLQFMQNKMSTQITIQLSQLSFWFCSSELYSFFIQIIRNKKINHLLNSIIKKGFWNLEFNRSNYNDK